MNRVQRHVHKKVLNSALSRACPNTIPRSGQAGAEVNCFIVELHKEGKPAVLVKSVDDEGVRGLGFDGRRYSEEVVISFDEFLGYKAIINHFYGLDEVRYDGVWDYYIEHSLRIPYLRLHLYRMRGWFSLIVFKSRPLTRIKKIALLQFLVKRHIEQERLSNSFSVWQIMQELYSFRWLKHPSGDSAQRHIELYLNSFVRTGDLEKNGTSYTLNPIALDTLARYEDEERRHKDAINIQRWIAILTFVLAVAALMNMLLTIQKDVL